MSQQKPNDKIEINLDLDELDGTSAEMKATYAEIKVYVLKEYGLKVSNLYINLYYYNSFFDAVVMKDKDDKELVIECCKTNEQVVFEESEDEGYLVRLAREAI